MEYFIKSTTETNDITDFLLKNPLHLAVLWECARRSRRAKEKCRVTGLEQREFFISETECEKFGLSKNQHGILARSIEKLINLKIIEKIGNKTGNKNCSVYRLADLSLFEPKFENREQNREEVGNRQGTDREQIGRKEEGIEGKEGKKGESGATDFSENGKKPRSREECEAYFLAIEGTENQATKFFLYYQTLGWKTKGGAEIFDWRALAEKWILTDREKEEKEEEEEENNKPKLSPEIESWLKLTPEEKEEKERQRYLRKQEEDRIYEERRIEGEKRAKAEKKRLCELRGIPYFEN